MPKPRHSNKNGSDHGSAKPSPAPDDEKPKSADEAPEREDKDEKDEEDDDTMTLVVKLVGAIYQKSFRSLPPRAKAFLTIAAFFSILLLKGNDKVSAHNAHIQFFAFLVLTCLTGMLAAVEIYRGEPQATTSPASTSSVPHKGRASAPELPVIAKVVSYSLVGAFIALLTGRVAGIAHNNYPLIFLAITFFAVLLAFTFNCEDRGDTLLSTLAMLVIYLAGADCFRSYLICITSDKPIYLIGMFVVALTLGLRYARPVLRSIKTKANFHMTSTVTEILACACVTAYVIHYHIGIYWGDPN